MEILLIFTLYLISGPCCSGPNTVSGYPGETVTISCSYPEEFKTNNKTFHKQDNQIFTLMIRTSETRRGRFSISDDRSSAALRVRISDVKEADGGVYYCGVNVGGQLFSSYSLYTETQLQVTAPDSSVIITVCVCVALLLIGGSALIFYKVRCTKRQVLLFPQISHSVCDYEEITDTRANPIYSTVQHPSAPPDPLNTVYTTAQLPSNTPVQNTCSMVQLPKLTSDVHAYATVSFQKNPDHLI
ncbi:hypothetical protein SRHO_G00177710 [Serrasalmus rhombeus]